MQQTMDPFVGHGNLLDATHTDPSVHSLLSRQFSHGKVGNHQLFALDLGPLVRISGGGRVAGFFGGLRTFSSWGWISLGGSLFVPSDQTETVHRASGSPVMRTFSAGTESTT